MEAAAVDNCSERMDVAVDNCPERMDAAVDNCPERMDAAAPRPPRIEMAMEFCTRMAVESRETAVEF